MGLDVNLSANMELTYPSALTRFTLSALFLKFSILVVYYVRDLLPFLIVYSTGTILKGTTSSSSFSASAVTAAPTAIILLTGL